MTEQHPVVERYLNRLQEHLDKLTPEERKEVVNDIRSHLAESVAAGRTLDAALESLGPADELARAYAVELLINPRQVADAAVRRPSRVSRFLKVAGLAAILSIPTLVIVVTLFAVGVSFTVSGLAVFAAGLIAATGELPYWIQMDVPPIFAILLGPVLMAAGILALIGLGFYIRFVTRAMRAVLPKGEILPGRITT